MSIFDLTLGAELIGILASTMLYGVTVLQTVQFFISPPPTSKRQPRLPQVIVVLACCLETAHTALVWTWMYWVVVTNYGNIAAINAIPWMLIASLMVYSVTGAMVQAFFTYRIYVITKSWKYALPGWILEVVSVVFTAVLCGVASHSTGFLDFHARYTWLAFVILINCAVIDVYNTMLLCWFLKRMDSGFSGSTHAVVNSVAAFAIETGILQAVAAVTTLVLWSAKPSSGLWVASLMIHTKLYSNSLLGTLNNRSRLRDKLSLSGVVGNETSRSESRSGFSGTRNGSRIVRHKTGSLPRISSDGEWAMNTISFRQDDGTEARPAIASKDSQDIERLGFELVERQ